MGILASLYSGISGLAANGNAMSVIGNNIANNNTVGFKSGRTLFSDLLSSNVSGSGGTSQVGRGVSLSSIDNILSQGTFENTESNTDLAIEGEGFFVVKEPLTNVDLFTRAGSFAFDESGFLTTPEGYKVQGYALAADGSVAGDLTEIQVDTQSLSAPRATENITLNTNLDADANYRGPFDITDPVSTSNYASSVAVYDSLGNDHLVTMYFSKMDPATNPLQWEFTATIDGSEVGAPAGPLNVGSGTLTFDADGNLLTTVPASPSSTPGVLAWSNNSDPNQQFNFNFATTQFSSESVVIGQSQDGYTTGSVAKLTIDNEGNVLGNFSNGLPKQLFRVALAKFSNPGGLIKEGSNMYSSSQASGEAVVGTVGSGIGKIFTNALEMSNVDLAGEFVKMITTQRGFQASSKIITSTDEMLSELINLKR